MRARGRAGERLAKRSPRSLVARLALGVTAFVSGAISSPALGEDIPAPVASAVSTPESELVPQEALERNFPGRETEKFPAQVYESIPPIENSASDFVPVPDRWRMFYAGKWYDPYNQNVLKGDIPVFGSPGHEWFTELSVISDSMFEAHRIPVGVGFASTKDRKSVV